MEVNYFPIVKALAFAASFSFTALLTFFLTKKYPRKIWPYIPAVIMALVWSTVAVRISSPATAERTTKTYDTKAVHDEPTINLQRKTIHQVGDNSAQIERIINPERK